MVANYFFLLITFLSAGKKVSCPGSTFISFSGKLMSPFFVGVFLSGIFFSFAMLYKGNKKTAPRIERISSVNQTAESDQGLRAYE